MALSSPLSTLWSKCVQYVDSDWIPRRFGGVLPAGRGGPAERPVRKLVDRPARVLLEPVIAPALRARVTQARPTARLIRRVVLEIAVRRRAAAPRPGAGRVPDLGQVPQLDPGIMALGLEPVIAPLGVDRVEPDQQIRPGSRNAQPPGPGFGRGREGESRSVPGPFPMTSGFRPGTAMGDGVALPVGHGHAPRRARAGGSGVRQVPGQPRVDRPE